MIADKFNTREAARMVLPTKQNLQSQDLPEWLRAELRRYPLKTSLVLYENDIAIAAAAAARLMFEFIFFHRRRKKVYSSSQRLCGWQKIIWTNKVKYLEVTIQRSLTWKKHVGNQNQNLRRNLLYTLINKFYSRNQCAS